MLIMAVTVLAAVFMAGCGSSGDEPTGPGPVDKQRAAERVLQANQIMMPRMAAIFGNHSTDTSLFDMSSAIALYREALGYDNTNTQAHFGLALTELVNLASDRDVWTLIQGSTTLLPAIAQGPAFLAGPYAAGVKKDAGMSVLPFSAGADAALPFSSFAGGLIPRTSAGHAPSYYQNIVETRVLPVTADVIAHLNVLTQYPDFAFYITSSMAGTELADSVRIDLTEVYVVLAAVRGLAAGCSFAVAYDIDYPDTSAAGVTQAWSVSAPFLQLRTNGVQRMKDTKAHMLGMASTIKDAIQFLEHQTPHPGVQLIPYRPEDLPKLTQAAAAMDSLTRALTSTIQVSGVAMNIGSFFDNPISNFKQKFPAYTVDGAALLTSGRYGVVLRWQALSFGSWYFPDPTFNGLFPGMTDAALKQALGLTAYNWQPTVTIGG
jgi:hypothetical protein